MYKNITKLASNKASFYSILSSISLLAFVGPRQAVVVQLSQRPLLHSPATPALRRLRRHCRTLVHAAVATRMPMDRRGSLGAGELLHDGAELVGVDEVHRRGRPVPVPPVRPPRRLRRAAATAVPDLRVVAVIAVAVALHWLLA